jgi:hypothetical protein
MIFCAIISVRGVVAILDAERVQRSLVSLYDVPNLFRLERAVF